MVKGMQSVPDVLTVAVSDRAGLHGLRRAAIVYEGAIGVGGGIGFFVG